MTSPNKDPLSVSEHEFGTVRVFTTALDAEDASNITAQNVHRLLGDVTLDAKKVQVVPTPALAGLGLTGYLREGYGVADEELAGRAAQLDAVTGLVVLLPASAFGGETQTLNPHPSMRFLGLFHEVQPDPPRAMSRPEAATGTLETPKDGRIPPPVAGRQRSWFVALGALLIAAAIVLLVVL